MGSEPGLAQNRSGKESPTEEVISVYPDDFYDQLKGRLRERIAKELRSADRVLDMGCGSCELAHFLARRNGQRVIGVDVSDGSFPASDHKDSRVECRQGNAEKLAFLQDGSVDAVVSVHSMHEIDHPVKALKEARRVLRSGGRMLVVDFPKDSLAQRLWNEDYFTSRRLSRVLKLGGFTCVLVELIENRQLMWATAE